SAEMRRCILRLYRSADGLRGFAKWHAGIDDMPPRGRVVWGGKDPFLEVEVAQRVAARAEVPLHVERDAGHWLPVTHPEVAAAQLRALWAS
ncbi:MAG: alpha/beta hydrolase, partial [bacterium]